MDKKRYLSLMNNRVQIVRCKGKRLHNLGYHKVQLQNWYLKTINKGKGYLVL